MKRFVDDHVRFGELILRFARAPPDPETEEGDKEQDGGQASQHEQGEFWRNDKEEDQARREHDALAEELWNGGYEGLLNETEIGCHAAGDFPHPVVTVVGHGETDELGVGIAPHVGQGTFPCATQELHPDEGNAGLDGEEDEENESGFIGMVEDGSVRHGFTDEVTHENGENQGHPAGNEHGSHGGEEHPPVTVQVGEDPHCLAQSFAPFDSGSALGTGERLTAHGAGNIQRGSF